MINQAFFYCINPAVFSILLSIPFTIIYSFPLQFRTLQNRITLGDVQQLDAKDLCGVPNCICELNGGIFGFDYDKFVWITGWHPESREVLKEKPSGPSNDTKTSV